MVAYHPAGSAIVAAAAAGAAAPKCLSTWCAPTLKSFQAPMLRRPENVVPEGEHTMRGFSSQNECVTVGERARERARARARVRARGREGEREQRESETYGKRGQREAARGRERHLASYGGVALSRSALTSFTACALHNPHTCHNTEIR